MQMYFLARVINKIYSSCHFHLKVFIEPDISQCLKLFT